ncbi:MAG TPA: glutaminyl-peptide cyclotransferase [Fibrobacteria bacterium]|nr:glutaminyl-peptide cyclotransferase [Fibrobacteria bacterium]
MRGLRLAVACAGAVAACVSVAQAQWAGDRVLAPVIQAEIPHDTAAFTQGLLWLEGRLYESTGLYGASSLRELDPVSGAVTRRVPVPDRYFAEGLAWYRGAFLQLTWKEHTLLRWPRDFGSAARAASGTSAPTSTPSSASSRALPPGVGASSYSGEGWGLATVVTGRDTALWMSNGSDTLYRRVLRNGRFDVTARVAVRWKGRPLTRLNELEGARGRIIANVWYSDSLFVIDPRDGRVTAVIDGTALAARSGRRSFHDVMNGVAWDPAKDDFYLTGKNWPKMFRVKLPPF